MGNSKLKILFKYPSRGRVSKFFEGLDSIWNNLYDPENFMVSCTLDEDDPTMNNTSVISRIHTYENVRVAWGKSDSKIHAVNRDMPSNEWDIVAIMSDDMVFNVYGFDEIIRVEMNNHFPEGDGYLHFQEKDSMANLNVMTICDRKYYDRFGYIYHPNYLSLWADNEQTEIAKMLGRYRYIPTEIFLHLNPAYGYPGTVKDEQFIRQQELGWTVDQETYNRRKAKNFDL